MTWLKGVDGKHYLHHCEPVTNFFTSCDWLSATLHSHSHSHSVPMEEELNIIWFLSTDYLQIKKHNKNNNHWSLGPLNCQNLLVRRKFDWDDRTLVFHAKTSYHLVSRAFDNHSCNTTGADGEYLTNRTGRFVTLAAHT